jgi:Na+/proline symporter
MMARFHLVSVAMRHAVAAIAAGPAMLDGLSPGELSSLIVAGCAATILGAVLIALMWVMF